MIPTHITMPIHPSSTKLWENEVIVPKAKTTLPPRVWSLIKKADEVSDTLDGGQQESIIPVIPTGDGTPVSAPTWFELHSSHLSGVPASSSSASTNSGNSVPKYTTVNLQKHARCNPLDDEEASMPDDDSGDDNRY